MYALVILVILLMYLISENMSAVMRRKLSTRFALCICVMLVLLAAFRADSVGYDTLRYREAFNNIGWYPSLDSLIRRYTKYYMGYYGLSKIFHNLGFSAQVWFGFIVAFYLFALMKLVDMFSKDKIFSLLVFITIGLWGFSMAGLKQTLAMSLMMLAFVAFVKKKYYIAAILVILVYFTHQSALIALAFVPLYYLRKSQWLLPLVIVSCLLIYLYSYTFMETMADILENEHWRYYLVKNSNYTYVTFIFYFVITAISYFNFKDYRRADPEYARYFMGLSTLGCGLQLLAGVSPSLFRLAYLYTPFFMITIPNTAYYCKPNNKLIFKVIIMGCLIFYFLYANRDNPYEFY